MRWIWGFSVQLLGFWQAVSGENGIALNVHTREVSPTGLQPARAGSGLANSSLVLFPPP